MTCSSVGLCDSSPGGTGRLARHFAAPQPRRLGPGASRPRHAATWPEPPLRTMSSFAQRSCNSRPTLLPGSASQPGGPWTIGRRCGLPARPPARGPARVPPPETAAGAPAKRAASSGGSWRRRVDHRARARRDAAVADCLRLLANLEDPEAVARDRGRLRRVNDGAGTLVETLGPPGRSSGCDAGTA